MRVVLNSNEFDFRFEVGITDVSCQLENRKHIVQSISNYFTVVRVKAQIDQLYEGMKCLGIDELFKAYPSTMHHLFVSQPQPLTSDSMMFLFQPVLSPEGSNRREDEEQLIMYWVHFLELIGCKLLS